MRSIMSIVSNELRRTVLIMSQLSRVSVILAILALSLPASAYAAPEAICPGGSSPRSDIKMCFDFESLGSCSTGREAACWTANGFTTGDMSDAGSFFIKSGSGAAAGNGYLVGKSEYGTTGAGYTSKMVPGGPFNSMSLRYYVKYTNGYMTYQYDHGPGMAGQGSTCKTNITLEQSMYNYFWYVTGVGSGCGGGSFDLVPNVGTPPVMENNRWYLIELQVTADTSCSNPTNKYGCNGIARMYIDGQKVMEYTNINWGGVTGGVKWNQIWGPRQYFHVRQPSWRPEIHFDNFAVSGTGAYIGTASGENARGTADPASPYITYQGVEPFLGKHPARDCSNPSAYLGTNFGEDYRSGASLQSTVAHAGFVDQCNNPPATDKALRVAISGSSGGGGIKWGRWGGPNGRVTFPAQVIYGWMYIPSTNDFSKKPSLAGFATYACQSNNCTDAQWGKHLAITVNNGKYALIQKDNPTNVTPAVVATSSRSVRYNQWEEFELVVTSDNKATLMINGEVVLNDVNTLYSMGWLFGGANGGSLVVGVIDFTGTGPFTIYYDDVKVGSASFWSCKGWGSASCPFGSTPADTTPPAPPTGLQVM